MSDAAVTRAGMLRLYDLARETRDGGYHTVTTFREDPALGLEGAREMAWELEPRAGWLLERSPIASVRYAGTEPAHVALVTLDTADREVGLRSLRDALLVRDALALCFFVAYWDPWVLVQAPCIGDRLRRMTPQPGAWGAVESADPLIAHRLNDARYVETRVVESLCGAPITEEVRSDRDLCAVCLDLIPQTPGLLPLALSFDGVARREGEAS